MNNPRPDRLARLKALGLAESAPFVYTSEMRIRADAVGEFEQRYVATTELARRQTACRFLEAHRSFTDPGLFLTYGQWESLAAFEAQESTQPWFIEYADATESFHSADRVVRVWTPLRAS